MTMCEGMFDSDHLETCFRFYVYSLYIWHQQSTGTIRTYGLSQMLKMILQIHVKMIYHETKRNDSGSITPSLGGRQKCDL